jgi:hypothetical protein
MWDSRLGCPPKRSEVFFTITTFPLTESPQSLNMASGDMSPKAIWISHP